MSWFSHGAGNGCAVTSKVIGLLSFMLGWTETSSKPDDAPVGIVMLIEASLHELMVTAAPSKYTTLLPCVAPNPEPAIVTWLPIGPVVAETLVMTGAGVVIEPTETLSNVAVRRV